MTPADIKGLQQLLLEQGFYTGKIDGVWGPQSTAAMSAAMEALTLRQQAQLPANAAAAGTAQPLAWGAKVSAEFRQRVRWICQDLFIPDPSWLMACIAWESGETFSPSIKNGAGSGATGLIQFMPKTAEELGTSAEALAKMTAEDQLNYVYKYFRPYKSRLATLSDLYMAILWPAAIGKPEDFTLWSQASRPTTYRQNAGLDVDRDLHITKAEAASKVQQKLDKGRGAAYALA